MTKKDDRTCLYSNDEAEYFLKNSRNQGKEEISRKLNKGKAFYNAINTPDGQILLKEYEKILDRMFSHIINFKHDDKLSVEQNYNNIMNRLVSYRAVQATGNEWSASIKELQQGIAEMRLENAKNSQ